MEEAIAWAILAYLPSLLCAKHAWDVGKEPLWLWLLLLVPLLAPAAYVVLILLPNWLGFRGPFDPPPMTEAELLPVTTYKCARDALAANPSLANQIKYAQAAAELNFREESESAWRAALDGGGANNPVVLLGYAKLLNQHCRHVEALSHLQTWQSLDERDTGETALLFAWVYDGIGRDEDADAAFRRAIAEDSPFKAKAHYTAFLAKQGRADEARQLFDALQQEFMDMPKTARRLVDHHLSVARGAVVKHGVI